MPGEKASECPHMVFGGLRQRDGAEIYRCKLLGQLLHTADGHESTLIDACCLQAGCNQQAGAAYIQKHVRIGTLAAVQDGWQWPARVMAPGRTYEHAVRDCVTLFGKVRARDALLEGVRRGLNAGEAQELINKHAMEVIDEPAIGS